MLCSIMGLRSLGNLTTDKVVHLGKIMVCKVPPLIFTCMSEILFNFLC
jgi:hypothetical protein